MGESLEASIRSSLAETSLGRPAALLRSLADSEKIHTGGSLIQGAGEDSRGTGAYTDEEKVGSTKTTSLLDKSSYASHLMTSHFSSTTRFL